MSTVLPTTAAAPSSSALPSIDGWSWPVSITTTGLQILYLRELLEDLEPVWGRHRDVQEQ